MNINILCIYPLDNGLKSYIKIDEEIYFITFKTNKQNAEFTVYGEGQSDNLLKNKEIRQEIYNKFILFLKQNKEEIKVGVYFNNCEDTFDNFFRLHFITRDNNNHINISFSILEDSFIITNLGIIKNKNHIIFDQANALFAHQSPTCFCENIKDKHGISDFEHCLVLIEHQELILSWIEKEYLKKFHPKKTGNVLQFPKAKIEQ